MRLMISLFTGSEMCVMAPSLYVICFKRTIHSISNKQKSASVSKHLTIVKGGDTRQQYSIKYISVVVEAVDVHVENPNGLLFNKTQVLDIDDARTHDLIEHCPQRLSLF
jgi:hypothetical protein